MLCAKWTKLGERLARQRERPDRVLPKDAVEIWRLMNRMTPESAATTFLAATNDPRCTEAATTAISFATTYFGTASSRGSQLIVTGTGHPADSSTNHIAQAAADWTQRFNKAVTQT